ncbi:serine hydrolase domain-containing protein [Streptacidiphilus jiangxiensis]|uniref:CubicO group peptidase, beta-lactamase class C family n=1 Tax=Streptacidiphilus jiangxiensis TaxID=235985 RepID=A0A1H7UR68_STRJI|nr:serine hydrolase domain-containing protein [Streptacidiphilus jiangxiensis]SEL99461.1 CubicO group peptidase, beta-lactamase class C family [Streptacidiphilus jiangxiensis]
MTHKRTALLCAATLLLSSAPALAGTAASATVATASMSHGHDCAASPTPTGGRAKAILDVIERDRRELKLRAVVGRVTQHGRDVWTGAVGPSMTGVPARPDMQFRVGSVGIAFMGTILLQLVDEKRVSLDDRISRWLPEIPHAKEITLRELADTTSGYHDYVTNPAFVNELEAHPFRHWTAKDVLAYAHLHDLLYKPGTNFSYSHGNFVLLGAALERITHTRLDRLLEQRIYRPLGLHATSNSYTPDIPTPVLHAFTSERGKYEESTFWNPSWTTAPGAVITQNICDLARAGAGIGSGRTISRKSYKTLLDPGTIGLGTPTKKCPPGVCLPQTEQVHYGVSVLVVNGWVVQNPSFSGYAAVMAYLPSEDLSIAVSVTYSPKTDQSVQNPGNNIAKDLSHLLVPNQPLV